MLRNRSFRLLIFGQTLSTLGDRALIIAFGIWVKNLTSSNSAAGAAFFFVAFPYLFAPFAGVLIDRFQRRHIFILANVTMALILLLALLVHSASQIWLLYAIILCYGISGIVISPTQSTLIAGIVGNAELAYANGLMQTGRDGVKLLAPLIGAALFTITGGHVIAMLDAATFIIAAACVGYIRVTGDQRRQPQKVALRRDLLTGVRYVFGVAALRRIVIAVGAALLVTGFSQTLWFSIVGYDLHRSSAFIGVLSSLQGAGAILAGLTAGGMTRRAGDMGQVVAGLASTAASALLLLVPGIAAAAAGSVLFGGGICWISVGMITAVQRRTPSELLGRALTAADGVVSAPQTVSIALGAGLALIVNYRILLASIAVVTGICAIWLRWRSSADEPGNDQPPPPVTVPK